MAHTRAGAQTPPSIAEVMRAASARLAAAGIGTARLDAEVLLRHVLEITRTELFLRYPEPLDHHHAAEYEALVTLRLAGQPVAYLTGMREFMGLPFAVAPGVLIPRPETEVLVEWALRVLPALPPGPAVDIGTGSGAIAVSMAAHAAPAIDVIATDVSPQALGIARENADAILDEARRARLTFRHGSLLEPFTAPVAMVLANLPYLTPDQMTGNPDLAPEPALALAGGADGLDLVRELVADLSRVLAAGGTVGLELDPAQAATVAALLREQFPERAVRILTDLAGLDRHVVMEPANR